MLWTCQGAAALAQHAAGDIRVELEGSALRSSHYLAFGATGALLRCVSCVSSIILYQANTHQHSTAQHSTAQHSAAQHSAAQRSTAQRSAAQRSTAQHSTAQHSTAQHSTARHSTARHGTAQHLPQSENSHCCSCCITAAGSAPLLPGVTQQCPLCLVSCHDAHCTFKARYFLCHAVQCN